MPWGVCFALKIHNLFCFLGSHLRKTLFTSPAKIENHVAIANIRDHSHEISWMAQLQALKGVLEAPCKIPRYMHCIEKPSASSHKTCTSIYLLVSANT